MKLWQKVFLGTFLLFEILFNVSSFYLIEHHFNRNLQNEIDRGLSEQLIVQAQINSDWSYVNSLNQQLGIAGGAQEFLKNNGARYTQYFNGGQVFIEILDNENNTAFSNFPGIINGPRAELEGLADGTRQYIIRDIDEKTYLFISDILPLDGSNLTLSYIRDISAVYSDKSAQVMLFLKMNVAVIIILAAGLYALIWFLTRSIRSLNKTAQTITGGDYTQRVRVLSKDEIGVLALSFNQMAEAVESKVDELEVTARNRQHFIEYLTHELKTPLTSIIGYAELLRSSKYDEALFFKALTYIYTEGKRLESLSFKLMDLILVGSEKPDMAYEDVFVACSEIEEVIRPHLEKYNVGLRMKVTPHTLLIERDLFKLLCTNLLDNAAKASASGSFIELRGYVTDDGRYALEIEDKGIGIPEEDIPKLCKPFFVVDKARSKAQHGAGLGLAICSEIIRLHEGAIDITSRINEGTKIRIVFPE